MPWLAGWLAAFNQYTAVDGKCNTTAESLEAAQIGGFSDVAPDDGARLDAMLDYDNDPHSDESVDETCDEGGSVGHGCSRTVAPLETREVKVPGFWVHSPPRRLSPPRGGR